MGHLWAGSASHCCHNAILLFFMWALLAAGCRKAIPCRLIVPRMGFIAAQKTKPGVWWGKSIPCGNGCGIQILRDFLWAVLLPWPLNTAAGCFPAVGCHYLAGNRWKKCPGKIDHFFLIGCLGFGSWGEHASFPSSSVSPCKMAGNLVFQSLWHLSVH